MDKKIHSVMMLTLLLIGMLTLAFNIQLVKSEPKTWTVDDDGPADFHTIQEAINAANSSDTIFVCNGTYYEHVEIHKNDLTVIGENRSCTVIDGKTTGSVIRISANNVTIKGFTVRNSAVYNSGIYIGWDYTGSVLQGNIITSNFCGVSILSSNNITVTDNSITNNQYGFYIVTSGDNDVVDNTITNNWRGIWLDWSNVNNIVNNKIAHNSELGIGLYRSSGNTLSRNTLIKNGIGIRLYGFADLFSNDNSIYHSNFINNTQQVSAGLNCTNIWDDGYPSGGNYWSDYEERYPSAEELDGSGIWDTPYVIDADNQDNYPLMEPWTPTPPIPATIDELKTEIEKSGSEGEIDNQGIVTSLLAKLNVARKLVDDGKIDQAKNILNAFINEVQAQSGKHITPEAAEILIESAEYILSNL